MPKIKIKIQDQGGAILEHDVDDGTTADEAATEFGYTFNSATRNNHTVLPANALLQKGDLVVINENIEDVPGDESSGED